MVTFQQLRIELCGKWILKIPIKNEMTKKQFSAWSLVWEGLGVFLLLLFTAKKVWSVLFLRVPFLFVNGSTVSSGEVTFCAPIACRNPTLLKLCLPTFPTRITARLAAIWGHWVLQKCFWHRRINIGVFSYHQALTQQGKAWTHRTTKTVHLQLRIKTTNIRKHWLAPRDSNDGQNSISTNSIIYSRGSTRGKINHFGPTGTERRTHTHTWNQSGGVTPSLLTDITYCRAVHRAPGGVWCCPAVLPAFKAALNERLSLKTACLHSCIFMATCVCVFKNTREVFVFCF